MLKMLETIEERRGRLYREHAERNATRMRREFWERKRLDSQNAIT